MYSGALQVCARMALPDKQIPKEVENSLAHFLEQQQNGQRPEDGRHPLQAQFNKTIADKLLTC